MFSAIYEGIILGVFLAFSFGPGFFALINTGIKDGFKPAASLAIGIFLSDVFLVMMTFVLLSYGASNYLSDPKNQTFLGIIGGIVLIVYGSFNFYQKSPKTETQVSDSNALNHLNIETNITIPQPEKKIIDKMEKQHPSTIWLGVKGFFLNLFNPFVWIFWVGTATAFGTKFQFDTVKITLFFTCALGTVISFDLLKAFVANKIKSFLTEKLMRRINITSGLVLILFGVYIIYKVFFLHEATI